MRQTRLAVTRQQIATALRVSMASTNVLMALANDGSVGPIRHQAARGGAVQTVYDLGSVIAWLSKVCLKFGEEAEKELRSVAFPIEAR